MEKILIYLNQFEQTILFIGAFGLNNLLIEHLALTKSQEFFYYIILLFFGIFLLDVTKDR